MLIGINGFKGAGKNVVGEYIAEQYGFEASSFAALLKQSAGALFKIHPGVWDQCKNDSDATVTLSVPSSFFTVSMTVREFLQRYGTESHREVFGYDFWIEQAFKQSDAFKDVVYTDARFENELATIKNRNGFNIQVLRSSTDGEAGGHVSEVRPDPNLIDYVVHNDGAFDDLYDQIDNIMEANG